MLPNKKKKKKGKKERKETGLTNTLLGQNSFVCKGLTVQAPCPFGVKAFALVFQVSLESLKAHSRVNVNWYSHFGEQYGGFLRN